MTPVELHVYRHLKEQTVILERQIAQLQELKRQVEQDVQRIEEQQKERSQLDLF